MQVPPSLRIPALSLTQPWASLLALGAKTIETRSWGTNYRGPCAIHASKGFPTDAQLLFYRPPFLEPLRQAGMRDARDLPRGAVLAIGRLVDCRLVGRGTRLPAEDSPEFAFGDFSSGRWLWDFADVEVLAEPRPARGALGLWEWIA